MRVAAGSRPCVKCYAVLAVVVLVVLALTRAWNPWPGVWEWVNRSDPIAAPVAAWQQRLGGAVQSVTITGTAVIVEYRTKTEAFGTRDGVPLWESDADWSAVAGGDRDGVVVTGELLTKGYQVRDPATGAVRRTDSEAVAVWTYANAVLDVRCLKAGDCELRAWDPRGSTPLWSVPVPGIGFVLFADNPALPSTRPLTGDQIDEHVAGPAPMPGLLGFPADGRLHLVDTAAGRVARTVTMERRQRVIPADHRVVTVTSRAADGTCYFTVTAADASGGQVWRADALNLRTAGDKAGCEQERDPVGGQNVLLGVTAEGREVLTDAHDGRTLWKGEADQKVLSVDDRYALIRAGDTVLARDFATGHTAFTRSADAQAQAAITAGAAIIVDKSPRRVVAVRPSDGSLLTEVRTTARVLAAGPAGLIVGEGRAIAYLPYAAPA